MKNIVRVLALFVITSTSMMQAFTAQATPPTSDARARRLVQQMAAENATNVGKLMPSGIEVLLSNGRAVDLRTLLRGRTILVKTIPGRCIPCDQFLAFIRANAVSLSKAQHASLVVLVTDSTKSPELSVPSGVTVLHTASKMHDGFLGGKLTPTTFFFDADHRLIKRHAGITGGVGETMQFPTAATRE